LLPAFAALSCGGKRFLFHIRRFRTFEQIQRAVDALRLSEFRSFSPVEIFRGGSVPSGKYSILLRAVFQSNERTLNDSDATMRSSQIIKALEDLGGVLRAS
jgi:phenylalanyl-tRNA synthetase beta chain